MSENPPTADERIVSLAETFHALAHQPAVKDWDPDALDEWAVGGASPGEKLAVQFVLAVYNPFEKWRCGPFNAVEASLRWDEKHWDAFKAWAMDPYTL